MALSASFDLFVVHPEGQDACTSNYQVRVDDLLPATARCALDLVKALT